MRFSRLGRRFPTAGALLKAAVGSAGRRWEISLCKRSIGNRVRCRGWMRPSAPHPLLGISKPPPRCCWDTNSPVGQATGLRQGRIWPLGWGMRWVGGPRGGDASVKRARVACARCGAGARRAAAGGCLRRRREKPLPGVFRLFSGYAAALTAASAFPGQIKVSEGAGKRG